MNELRCISAGILLILLTLQLNAQEEKPKGVDWTERKYAFEMNNRKWVQVLSWLSDEAQLPIADAGRPTGKFTFRNPGDGKGNPRKYSLTEAYDIINEQLQNKHKYHIIRQDTSLTLIALDDALTGPLPRVPMSELSKRGKTEIVEVVVNLNVPGMNTEEIAPLAKKMLGEFSRVTSLPAHNYLIVRATVSRLLTLEEALRPRPDSSPSTYLHKCKYIKAAVAKAALYEALEPAVKPLDGKGNIRGVRYFTIALDRATNSVIIHGFKIAQAKDVLAKIDVGQAPYAAGPFEFRYHDVKAGNADEMQKLFARLFKDDASVRIQVAGASRLFVYGDPQTHREVIALMRLLRSDSLLP